MKTSALVLTVVAAVSLAVSSVADERTDMRRDAVVVAVEKAAPAVVNISTDVIVERSIFPGLDMFSDLPLALPTQRELAHSLGSGGIFTPDGYIFTNAHVLDRATTVTVTLSDGTQYPAKLLSVDPGTDLAVIKIDADKALATLVFGRSDDLLVGEQAIAVGNPFGLSNTVTTGVISAIHRDVVENGEVVFKDFLQTDTLINPGNSGGPLLNIFGEVIGVNTAMRANAQGIGFAIPIDRVKTSLAALMDYRPLRRLRLGFNVEEKFPTSGPAASLVIGAVEAGGPADKAGMKVGDIITSANGRSVGALVDFMAAMLSLEAENLPVTVTRADKTLDLSITPLAIPKPDPENLARSLLGASIRQMDRSQAGDVGIDIDRGIRVTGVTSGSPAALAGIRKDDVILQVNNVLVADLNSLANVLEASQGGPGVYLVVLRREHRGRYLQFKVEVPFRALERS